MKKCGSQSVFSPVTQLQAEVEVGAQTAKSISIWRYVVHGAIIKQERANKKDGNTLLSLEAVALWFPFRGTMGSQQNQALGTIILSATVALKWSADPAAAMTVLPIIVTAVGCSLFTDLHWCWFGLWLYPGQKVIDCHTPFLDQPLVFIYNVCCTCVLSSGSVRVCTALD